MEIEEQVEQQEPVVIIDEKPKRGRRGRPPKVSNGVQAEVEGAPAKRQPARRTAKLTGQQVSQGITLVSQLIVLNTGRQHWYIPPEETKDWADEAAKLLNRIPGRWVNAVTNASSAVVVAVGVYKTVVPRLMIDRELAEQERAQRSPNGTEAVYQA
jgi:hypothetical protein